MDTTTVTHPSIRNLVVTVDCDLTNSAGVAFLDLVELKCNFMHSSRVGRLLSVKMERFVGFGSLGRSSSSGSGTKLAAMVGTINESVGLFFSGSF